MRVLSKIAERSTLWKLIAFPLVVALCANSSGQWSIPPDKSLSVERYREMGMASPDRSWSIDDYLTAITVLNEVKRVELPREGSSSSSRVFERILVTYEQLLKRPEERFGGRATKRLESDRFKGFEALYSAREGDSLFFDLEMVEIRAAKLRAVLDAVPTRETVKERTKKIRTTEGIRADEASQMVREYEESLYGIEMLVRRRFTELAALAAIEEMRTQARRLLAKRLAELAPQMGDFLRLEDLKLLAQTVRSAANAPHNDEVKGPLLDVAAAIEAESDAND